MPYPLTNVGTAQNDIYEDIVNKRARVGALISESASVETFNLPNFVDNSDGSSFSHQLGMFQAITHMIFTTTVCTLHSKTSQNLNIHVDKHKSNYNIKSNALYDCYECIEKYGRETTEMNIIEWDVKKFCTV